MPAGGCAVASVERRERDGKKRWYARYRTIEGSQRTKTFDRRIDAEKFLAEVEAAKNRGAFVDPRRQRITVGEWADQWLAGKANLAPKTRETYEMMIEGHIRPRWGTVAIGKVAHVDVQAWVAGIERAPATVHKIHQIFGQIMALAIKDGRLAVNPCAGIDLPRVGEAPKRFLTHAQVEQLADACDQYGLVVRFLAYTGLRFGEMAALRVGRVDFLRRRALVAESATPVRGAMTLGPTKGRKHREVPLPTFLIEDLSQAAIGKGPDDFLFAGGRGAVLRSRMFQRDYFDAAAAEVGLDGLTPHELRHTAASLAIASGADVKVVQQMLGHEKASLTLDLYGHLFTDRLDVVAEAMDQARTAALYGRPRIVAKDGS